MYQAFDAPFSAADAISRVAGACGREDQSAFSRARSIRPVTIPTHSGPPYRSRSASADACQS